MCDSEIPEGMPEVSIILPHYNGHDTLARAVASVCNQTFLGWELLIVDDCSTEGSFEVIEELADRDVRIRAFRLPEHRGRNSARNFGLASARASAVAYLNDDEEFYPDYLECAIPFVAKGDVVISGYDIVTQQTSNKYLSYAWNPESVRSQLLLQNVALPLGVLHRKSLVIDLGGFNDLLLQSESWELWRRLARSGAEFIFLPIKSGKHYRLCDDRKSELLVPEPVRRGIEENRAAGRPLYASPTRHARRTIKKIAFVAPSSLFDFTSGAAIATLRQLVFLRHLGFECHAFCGSLLDVRREEMIEETLARRGIPYEVRCERIGVSDARLLFAAHKGVPLTQYCSSSTVAGFLSQFQLDQFLEAIQRFIRAFRPDAVMTFGGGPLGQAIIKLLRSHDIPIVFCLKNFAYADKIDFEYADYVFVPSDYSRRHYWNALQLECTVLPNVINDDAVLVREHQPKYVVFVNPQPTKGVYVFARIAEELGRRRPDIALLAVESRGRAEMMSSIGLDLRRFENLTVIPNTPSSREFYETTKILLMPSLWRESFGLAAAEALYNGIPVLASNRGALPEIVGEGGYLFDIPARYTPQSRDVPSAEEVESWVETIIRLWDDPQEYAAACVRARNHAQRWHPDRLAPIYREFFSNLAPQPFPPLAPPGVT
jgi:glycosyltransferase involved in cell wall biosynthesis